MPFPIPCGSAPDRVGHAHGMHSTRRWRPEPVTRIWSPTPIISPHLTNTGPSTPHTQEEQLDHPPHTSESKNSSRSSEEDKNRTKIGTTRDTSPRSNHSNRQSQDTCPAHHCCHRPWRIRSKNRRRNRKDHRMIGRR